MKPTGGELVIKGSGDLLRGALVGFLLGLLLGLVDTYGYAVTGYTTSELSPLVSAILVLIVYRVALKRTPNTLEHFVGVVVASGIALSSAITSGMYITYTMLKELSGNPAGIGLPEWTYFKPGLPDFTTFSFYLFATAISGAGIIMAYVFHKHFIERERLSFPLGIATATVMNVGKVMRRRLLMIPVASGVLLEFAVIYFNVPGLDLTPGLQGLVPGSSLGLTLDLMIFFLALIIPLGTSVGISVGNFFTYLALFPILASLGYLISMPGMSMGEVIIAAAPYTASIMVGYLVVVSTLYFLRGRQVFCLTLKYLVSNSTLLRNALVSVGLMSLAAVPVIVVLGVDLKVITVVPMLVLHVILTLVTVRVVGEAGTASQATLPLATITLHTSGWRGAVPYIFLDPYTGVPMPQFMAGSATNLMKTGRLLNVDAELTSLLLLLAVLLGAPLTLLFGHALLLIYGTHSPKLNLLRWVPVVTWMNALYSGSGEVFNLVSLILGALMALFFALAFRVTRLGGIPLYSLLLGITITPDLGILFAVASVIKYIALRLGTNVYEALVTHASLLLGGAGLGVAISSILAYLGWV